MLATPRQELTMLNKHTLQHHSNCTVKYNSTTTSHHVFRQKKNVAKERIENKSKLLATPKSHNTWNTVPSPKYIKTMQFEDRAVSIKDFEAFCSISFDATPPVKPIDA